MEPTKTCNENTNTLDVSRDKGSTEESTPCPGAWSPVDSDFEETPVTSPSSALSPLTTDATNTTQSGTPDSDFVVHDGVGCDGENCSQLSPKPELAGTRYKCTVCDDTDFCTSCEPKHDVTHPRLMYRVPRATCLPPQHGFKPSDDDEIWSALESLSPIDLEKRWDEESGPESYDDLVKRMKIVCDDDERILISNIADLSKVPDDYSHIYLDPNVITALETNIHLSLMRRSEFNYGVLQHNRLTGAIVFGPPGTGKTLASRAVARKCRLNMLSISSGDIFHKGWGDDEKAIRAAFGLARKLYPCIMFVDEADGVLGKRQDDDKKHVRSMLSEFLREWDGAAEGIDRNPFVLLASNMPWDIDPAILRRAPVRILIDVPSLNDRKGILNILLRDEKLGGGLTVDLLAGLTRSFSGSDLKSLCVSAAIRCVGEQVPDENGKYPETRELCRRHFDFAFRYVKASTSNKFMSRKLLEFQRNSL